MEIVKWENTRDFYVGHEVMEQQCFKKEHNNRNRACLLTTLCRFLFSDILCAYKGKGHYYHLMHLVGGIRNRDSDNADDFPISIFQTPCSGICRLRALKLWQCREVVFDEHYAYLDGLLPSILHHMISVTRSSTSLITPQAIPSVRIFHSCRRAMHIPSAGARVQTQIITMPHP